LTELVHHGDSPGAEDREIGREHCRATKGEEARGARRFKGPVGRTAFSPSSNSSIDRRTSADALSLWLNSRMEMKMAKVVCVLYDDPVDGYPKSYARDDIPKITKYPDGQTAPTPSAIDFKPGELLGSVSGELGLRKYLEKAGHTLVVTSDKDGKNSKLDQELHDAEIVISQPFWPAYMTAERIAKAPKLKMIVTDGIGSDHTDLQAAIDRGITVPTATATVSPNMS
jgi:hypothetical protein